MPQREPRASPRAPRSTSVSTRARQSPSVGWCGVVRTTITLAPPVRSTPSSWPRATIASRSVVRRPSTSFSSAEAAASLARAGASERSTSWAMSVPTSRSRAAGGSWPRAR